MRSLEPPGGAPPPTRATRSPRYAAMSNFPISSGLSDASFLTISRPRLKLVDQPRLFAILSYGLAVLVAVVCADAQPATISARRAPAICSRCFRGIRRFGLTTKLSDPAHGTLGLQPERGNRLRSSAWLRGWFLPGMVL